MILRKGVLKDLEFKFKSCDDKIMHAMKEVITEEFQRMDGKIDQIIQGLEGQEDLLLRIYSRQKRIEEKLDNIS